MPQGSVFFVGGQLVLLFDEGVRYNDFPTLEEKTKKSVRLRFKSKYFIAFVPEFLFVEYLPLITDQFHKVEQFNPLLFVQFHVVA